MHVLESWLTEQQNTDNNNESNPSYSFTSELHAIDLSRFILLLS